MKAFHKENNDFMFIVNDRLCRLSKREKEITDLEAERLKKTVDYERGLIVITEDTKDDISEIEFARELYFEKTGEEVPRNKKNDLTWIKSKTI